jgi:hypothetical protein
MYSLVYVSSALTLLSRKELETLLVACRANNARDGITGLLLYKDGNFMQMLEGERSAVEASFRKIQTDPRHHGIIKLLEGDAAAREFGEWSMGLRDLRSAEAERVPGYSEFLNSSLLSEEFTRDPSRGRKLLLVFKAAM